MKQKELREIAEKMLKDLTEATKVDIMVDLYLNALDDYHKDEFLRRTGNQ